MKQRLFILIIVLLSSFAMAGCSATSSPTRVAKHFYKAIEEGNYELALSYTTLDKEADSEIYYAIMQKVNTSITEKGGIDKLELVNEEYAEAEEGEEPTKATITTQVTYANGSAQEEMCDVVKIEDKWLVDVSLDSK